MAGGGQRQLMALRHSVRQRRYQPYSKYARLTTTKSNADLQPNCNSDQSQALETLRLPGVRSRKRVASEPAMGQMEVEVAHRNLLGPIAITQSECGIGIKSIDRTRQPTVPCLL